MSLTMDKITEAIDAIISAREASMEEPTAIQGNRYTLCDFLMDTKVPLERASSPLSAFAGVPLIYDEEMPPGVIDIQCGARVVRRLIALGNYWYACAVPDAEQLPMANPRNWG